MITAMPRIAIAVHDFDKAVATFRDTFGMPVLDLSTTTVPSLGASVAMCVPPGGSNIELMAPATSGAPLAQSLRKFLDHRGEGLYALMLEAPDPNVEAEAVAARGLDVLPLMEGAGGRDLHPRSTHGVLIRIYPDNSVDDRGPHEERAPYLSGIMRVIVATADASKAASVYGEGLGIEIGDLHDDAGRGVTVATAQPAMGGKIELVSAIDSTKAFARRIDEQVTERGPGMFALVLDSPDPTATITTLRSGGIEIVETDDFGTEASVFGARFLLA